ncbi:MAG: 3-methyl-2-oxobutanoate hydroxymethyltransferase [Candidatus Alcyoniella australis]|nr:3-methyl-2-oxobutanoate hydroxymethyltransferase [Candidatus Alcyoniella australis]
MKRKKVDIGYLNKAKSDGEKITMLTAYDYPTALMLDEAGVETILVGDSAANVVLGYRDTLPVTMDELLVLTRAVSRGLSYAMLIGDMPFGSYNASVEQAIVNATRFIKEGNCDAVKLEGGGRMIEIIGALVQSGIPVVGHLGLTPQTAGMIGGYRVQGRTADRARIILEDSLAIEQAGAFMLVLECVPDRLAKLISEQLSIPIIGIGAGVDADGQVLVVHDMLGIKSGFSPKFVKKFAEIGPQIVAAAKDYVAQVKAKQFPAAEHTFTMPDKEFDKI